VNRAEGSAAAAVYTALLGGYEQLNEDQPRDSRLPFICFTDDPRLRSTTWDIRLVEPAFPLDLVRSQRDIKLRGHPALDEFSESMYIDNSVTLTVPPEDLLRDWLAEEDLALVRHSNRVTVLDEFTEVLRQGLEEPARLFEQLDHYAALAPDILERRPLWAAVMARRRTPSVDAFFAQWFDHVLRYSRRDQLSLVYVLESTSIPFRVIEAKNEESEWHRWPVPLDRLEWARSAAPTLRRPDLLALGEMRSKIADLEARMGGRDDASQAALAVVREMQSSTSWKITAPVRWLGRLGPGRGRRRW